MYRSCMDTEKLLQSVSLLELFKKAVSVELKGDCLLIELLVPKIYNF